MATTTYPEKKKKKKGISNWRKFFSLDIVSTAIVCPKCICFFFGNCERLWLIGNGTWVCVVQYCKSRSSDFVNHSYDHRPKWSPLGPITIMFNWSSSFILPYKALCIFPWFDKISFALHPSRTTKTTNCTSPTDSCNFGFV